MIVQRINFDQIPAYLLDIRFTQTSALPDSSSVYSLIASTSSSIQSNAPCKKTIQWDDKVSSPVRGDSGRTVERLDMNKLLEGWAVLVIGSGQQPPGPTGVLLYPGFVMTGTSIVMMQ